MERIYRFEGLFNGVPQGVGLFQELDEMALPISEVRELTGLFDSLPCPDLDEPVSFWFTEEGLQIYEAAINYVNGRIALHNWSLAGAFMLAPGEEGALFKKEEIIYQDKKQIAFSRESVLELTACDDIMFDEIANVDTFRMTSRNSAMLAFQREINKLAFDAPPSVLKELGKCIIGAYSDGPLCGQEFDALMYQLWQKNPELIGHMGYTY